MWMSLFSTILVLLIAFFQAVQGLFSGLIMCLLTILSAAAAFSLAEPLANWWMQWIHPDYALAGAFIVIFVLCLTITRTLADNFVPGNVRFTLWVDRAGGGLAGLVAGLIIVGMLCIGLQMLPFDAELMGFNRLQIGEDGRARRGSLWLNPDGFTVGLISTLANGSLAGAHRLEQLHPDWLMEIQWNRSGVQKESLHAVPAGSIDVEAAWDLRRPLMQRGGGGLVEPAGGYRFIVVRVSLSSRAADPDGRHRFTPTQWRLVGRLGRQWMQTPLRGISDAQEPSQLVGLRLDDAVVRSSSEAARLDLLFEVPESRDFQPVFVEYKRLARAAVRLQDKPLPGLKRKAARGGAPEVGPGKAPRRKARPAPRGRVSGRRARQTDSRFSDELPIALAPAELSSQNASIAAGRLQQGHIVVALDGRRSPPRSLAIGRFDVPPNMRLLQLAVTPLFAKSTLGRAMQFAVKTVRQYRVEDERGRAYFPIGEYRLARVGGRRFLELQYWPGAAMPERALENPIKIHERDLERGGQLFYLFLVPPETRIVVFKTGRQRMDLTRLKLVAPP